MSNIPDFSNQMLEVEKQLKTQIVITQEDWQDEKAETYHKEHLQQYEEIIQLYLNGGMNMIGMGLIELMEFVSRKMDDMERLTGVPADVQFDAAAGGLHNGWLRDNRDNMIAPEDADIVKRRDGMLYGNEVGRDYWTTDNGVRPGEYTPDEIQKHYENRDDVYKR